MQGGQDHLRMLRRCLHFDDGQSGNTASGSDSRNAFGNEGIPRSAAPTAEVGHINPSSPDKTAHPADRQLPNSSLTIGESIGKGTKPSGFGLHLNSFINSVQCGETLTVKSIGSGSLSIHGKSSSIIRLHSSESLRSCSLSCNEANQFLSNINNDKIERDQAVAATSETSLFPYCTKLSEFEYLKELQPIPPDKRKYSTANRNINEELSQSSPKKKRLKKSDGGDGCKRCNCKKTKCLKLYCDCFAAGIYCAEPCACQGCFNKPEYEDIVIGTRLQIESRDPHAFAPKIIQHATEASTKKSMEDVIHSSARHKRGCNCKKSMCLKKYCECYQANVGCSYGCRCDGCQNVYGPKEEHGKYKYPSKQNISILCDVGEKQQEVASTNDTLCTQEFSPLDLTPNHGKDGSKSWFSSGIYLPSPESVTFADSYPISPGSPENINYHGIFQDVNKDVLHLVPFHQELDDGPGACSITDLSPILGPHDYWATRIESQPIYENRNLSSGSSLRWHRSPISLATNFEENKYLGSTDSGSGLCEVPEDDTPDILKDNVTPLNSVKVCSPNKKRVSPPHAIVQELGSGSSAGLKTCRKFILKSVPSFRTSTDSIAENPEPNQS